MLARHLGLVGMAAIALTVAACASSSSSGTAASGGASTSAPAGSASAPAPAAAGSSSAGSPSAGAAPEIKTAKIDGQTVLTTSAGRTLYWFVPDTSTKSVCNGSCASYWPPVKGPVSAGPGVTGKLGTITRADGSVQATYDGHPLYTYVADTASGEAKGNGVNASGGLWWEMTASGAKPASQAAAPAAPAAPATPAPKTSSGGGGYGY